MLSIIIQRTKLSLFYEYNAFQFRFKMEETEHEMRSKVDNPYCTFIPILKDGNKKIYHSTKSFHKYFFREGCFEYNIPIQRNDN